jgi:hypothetical protein
MRILLLSLTFTSVVSCGVSTELFVAEYEYSDNVKEGRIDLVFKNDRSHTVCLLPEFWPNRAGKFNQGSELVSLIIDGTEFAIEDFNTGYCPSCVIAVVPGEEVIASVKYADFDLRDQFYNREKTLVYELKVYYCRY